MGNSDIGSEFVYEASEDLVDIIAAIKQIEGVDRVIWSEEVFRPPTHKENIMRSFKKYLDNSNNYNNSRNRKNNGNNIKRNNNNNGISKKKNKP